ncbi:MAG TPA: hypothetical protein VL588_02705 [Bdellovibrionota bacterium]|jgi:hypothetical protein|nr:hypothetical protein [Bdellovibrionota bacterium]
MPNAVDVAVIGTGAAPLVAARHLLEAGRSVLVLNPDWDFFREDSELPLDPLWPPVASALSPKRLARSSPDRLLARLRPEFPGPVELWSGEGGDGTGGYHDLGAPHARARGRLWLHSTAAGAAVLRSDRWERIEEMYVGASDAGFHPQILEGLPASRRFPGHSGPADELDRGVLIPRLCDVDVSRFRTGLQEYLRERLGPDGMVSRAGPIELAADGVRYRRDGAAASVSVARAVLIFWTPRLTPWLESQFTPQLKKEGGGWKREPTGARVWELWNLVSRDPVDPSTVGVFGDLTVWVSGEGVPGKGPSASRGLSVLRPGARVGLAGVPADEGARAWVAPQSFAAVEDLARDLLGWDRFSIRSVKPRVLMEWDPAQLEDLSEVFAARFKRGEREVSVVAGADGPLADVVESAARAAEAVAQLAEAVS